MIKMIKQLLFIIFIIFIALISWCYGKFIKTNKQIIEEGEVIFEAKLKKGENLSKVIEQVLYPRYIDKKIIIKVIR